MSTAPAAATSPAAPEHKESVKETLISIIIAFVLAFVFRGFVIEAFVIPTGSMAPTLMGAHMRFTGERSGHTWPVAPWYYAGATPDAQAPLPFQGTAAAPVVVHDPMTGDRVEQTAVRTRSGDRILVLKYLYALREPQRFDVVVFKNPRDTGENYIKRLVGLAGEQIALVDGDVFFRPAPPGTPPPDQNILKAAELWEQTDWKIARKPADAARAVWQCVFDSSFTPPGRSDLSRGFVPPWVGAAPDSAAASPAWEIAGRRDYDYAGTAPTVLRWDSTARFWGPQPQISREVNWPSALAWTIDDRYAYDEIRGPTAAYKPPYPVSDIRMRCVLEPRASGRAPDVIALLRARGHEFRARLSDGKAFLEKRTAPSAASPDPAWEQLGSADAPLPAGAMTQIEFWHLDQSLQLWLDGKRIAYGEYNWTPAQRAAYATGHPFRDLLDPNNPDLGNGVGLINPQFTIPPAVEWRFDRGPFTLHRVAVDRDLHYRPALRGPSAFAWATHPTTTLTLTADEFFVCGDNSPESQDGRLWPEAEPWVKAMLDPKAGVVPRRLMLGKAFFVYFPALAGSSPIPVPDFGRLRFIR